MDSLRFQVVCNFFNILIITIAKPIIANLPASIGVKTNSFDAERKSDKPLSLLWDMIEIPILLVLIGVSSAIISFFTSYVVMIGNGFRWSLMGASSDYNSLIFYCIWCQVF